MVHSHALAKFGGNGETFRFWSSLVVILGGMTSSETSAEHFFEAGFKIGLGERSEHR
jgi:hypothetical protein